MALPIDGTASNYWVASSGTLSLTTTQADDIVCVAVALSGNPGHVGVVSIMDHAGLQWNKRSGGALANAGTYDWEVWWAHAPAALIGDTITINNGSSTNVCALAFGLAGLYAASPWDANGALPVEIDSATTVPPLTGLSSTTASGIAVIFAASWYNWWTNAGYNALTGYSKIIEQDMGSIGSYEPSISAWFKITAAPLVNETVAFAGSTNNNLPASLIGDVLTNTNPAPEAPPVTAVKGAKSVRILASVAGDHTFRTVTLSATGPAGVKLANQVTDNSGHEIETVYAGPTGASGFKSLVVAGYTGPA